MFILYMRFKCARGRPLYLVGNDAEIMRRTARQIDHTADSGEVVSQEECVNAAGDNKNRIDSMQAGEDAVRGGCTDYLVF